MTDRFTEKRENVRTFLSARVSVKQVTKDYAEAFSGFFTGLSSAASPSERGKEPFHGINDGLIGMFLNLDDKLDHILSIVSNDLRLAPKKCEALDISGTGLCVVMPEEAKIGDNFEVTIRFAGSPVKVLKACAEVVRVSPYNGHRFEIGMKFMDLTETEKECLIALTFSENRKRIREKKNILEND